MRSVLLRAAAILAALLFLMTSVHASTVGSYAGAGYSAQERNGHKIVCGPTSISLVQNLNDSWSFDIHLVKLPILGCDGFSAGTVSFPSFLWSNNLTGSPATGFVAAGSYHLINPNQHVDWALTVSPLGFDTTWSIAFFSITEGVGARHTWWNGTADMVGASA